MTIRILLSEILLSFGRLLLTPLPPTPGVHARQGNAKSSSDSDKMACWDEWRRLLYGDPPVLTVTDRARKKPIPL